MTISPRFAWRSLAAVLLATPLLLLPCLAAIAPRAAFAQEKSSTGQKIPPNPIEAAERNGTALHISLRDLTKLALQNNLDIAISDTNEELYQQRLIQTYGPYDPALSAGLGVQSNKRSNTNLTNRSTLGNFNKTDSWRTSSSSEKPSDSRRG